MSNRAQMTLAAALATLLAASSLGSVLTRRDWWFPVLCAVLVASGCGALGRRLPGPAPLLPLLTPIGLVAVVTAVGASQTAWLGIVPRGQTVHALRALVRSGLDDLHTYAPPAPATRGLLLLAVAGTYVVAAVVDLLAVTASRPALAGLPLLLLVAVPAGVRSGGVGVVHLALAASGWLMLVALDGRNRLARWGRPLGRHPVAEGSALLGGSAGRIAGVALCAGLIAPAVVPPFQHNVLSGHGKSGACCGHGGKVQLTAPLVTVESRLHGEDVPLLTVTYTGGKATYLRGTSLDIFDGNSFTMITDGPSPVDKVYGQLPGVLPTTASHYPLTVRARVEPALADKLLPLPYQPTWVKPSRGIWLLAPTLRVIYPEDSSGDTRGVAYDATSQIPDPTVADLEAVGTVAAGALPAGIARDLRLPTPPTALVNLAHQIVHGTATTEDQLLALEAWFTNPSIGHFTYDLNASVPRGYAGLQSFLLSTRRGYCEQFAAAFVVLARILHIPARVATGFTPGTRQSDGTFQIRTHDAHAWPEVWFPGAGWLTYDPTPRDDTASVQTGYNRTRAAAPVTAPSAAPTPTTPASGATQPRKAKAEPASSDPTASPARSSGTSSGAWLLVAVAVAGAAGTLPALLAVARRARRRRQCRLGGPAAARAAWAELCDTLVDAGLPPAASETPRVVGRRLAQRLPAEATRSVVDRLVRAEEWARYAPPGRVPGPDQAVQADDVAVVRQALLATRPRGVRWRAVALPPSVLAAWGRRNRWLGRGTRGRPARGTS